MIVCCDCPFKCYHFIEEKNVCSFLLIKSTLYMDAVVVMKSFLCFSDSKNAWEIRLHISSRMAITNCKFKDESGCFPVVSLKGLQPSETRTSLPRHNN